MIRCSKKNRDNYPRKGLWTHKKKTESQFNPRVSAKIAAFEQLGQDSIYRFMQPSLDSALKSSFFQSYSF